MLLHITDALTWQTALQSGIYVAPSLESEGFIHCSTPAQVLGPANAFYHGQTNLLLLCITPAQVRSPIVYEDCYQTGQAVPHIYGPLNLDAIAHVVDFPPCPDGTFCLPEALALLL
ncbi:MAG TPA: DUF952 domain-containing protein [Chroococcidiopsis sp.]